MTEEKEPDNKKPELPPLPEGFKMVGDPIAIPLDKIERGWDDVVFDVNPNGTIGALGIWARHVAFGFPLAYFRKAYAAFLGFFSGLFLAGVSLLAIVVMPITMMIFVVGSFFYALFGKLTLELSPNTVHRMVKGMIDKIKKEERDNQD
jgi:hypothetical protein